jgi:hypothetical protein
MVNVLMDRVGAPPNLWLQALQYVCFLLNHTYSDHINGIPLEKLTGQQIDISVLTGMNGFTTNEMQMINTTHLNPLN